MTNDSASAAFAELSDTATLRVSGADARTFLHAQLTSDVAGLGTLCTQYAGYCSPKGRLLATFLVWSLEDCVLLQLPRSLAEPIRARLAKYVLRSKVELVDATSATMSFGVYGAGAAAALAPLTARLPERVHEVAAKDGVAAARLPGERYAIVVPSDAAAAVREMLETRAQQEPHAEWARRDIAEGIPVITAEAQEQYVPQMVNLDLIGAVSYSKGCYPGQEIVARTHYLGRLKQRMYRIHAASALAPGDALYSTAFGAEQASGTIVNAAPDPAGGYDALAVIQTAAAARDVLHLKALDGPALELKPSVYTIPA